MNLTRTEFISKHFKILSQSHDILPQTIDCRLMNCWIGCSRIAGGNPVRWAFVTKACLTCHCCLPLNATYCFACLKSQPAHVVTLIAQESFWRVGRRKRRNSAHPYHRTPWIESTTQHMQLLNTRESINWHLIPCGCHLLAIHWWQMLVGPIQINNRNKLIYACKSSRLLQTQHHTIRSIVKTIT